MSEMIVKKKQFRNEWKFLISEWEADHLRQRLKPFMDIDHHAVNGEYFIRSLYFDDPWNSCYEEKMMGSDIRQKWRIRIYNYSDNKISLERKRKVGSYIQKDSAPISREEYQMILNGDYDFMLHHSNPLLQEFYYESTVRLYRPKVIVDYEREPFIMDEGNVRITFDKGVRAAIGSFDIFDKELPTLETLEPGTLVLEVKYTEYLPGLIKELLPLGGQEFTAVSKYVLCFEKAHFLTDPLAGVVKDNWNRRFI